MLSSPTVEYRPPGLSVSPVSAGPCLVVAMAGEADWVTAPQLREQLTAALAYGPRSLVLDLTDLVFCNSAGLRALLGIVAVARRAGVQVEMRGMSGQLSFLYRTFLAHHRTGGHQGRLPDGLLGSRLSSDDAQACRPAECACESALQSRRPRR